MSHTFSSTPHRERHRHCSQGCEEVTSVWDGPSVGQGSLAPSPQLGSVRRQRE